MRLEKDASLETFHTKNERELRIKHSRYGTVFFLLGPHGIFWGELTGYVTYRKICVCSRRIFWHLKHKKRARIANKNIKLLQFAQKRLVFVLLFSFVGPSKYKTCSSHPFELKFSGFMYFFWLSRILFLFSKKSRNSLQKTTFKKSGSILVCLSFFVWNSGSFSFSRDVKISACSSRIQIYGFRLRNRSRSKDSLRTSFC